MKKAITTIVPKPTKTQVVEAMLERLKVARSEKKAKLEKEVEEKTVKLKELLKKDLIKKGPTSISFSEWNGGRGNCNFECSAATKKLGIIIEKKITEARNLGWLDEAKAKREIREGLEPKIDILKNPDAKAAVDEMVGRIFGIKPALILENKEG